MCLRKQHTQTSSRDNFPKTQAHFNNGIIFLPKLSKSPPRERDGTLKGQFNKRTISNVVGKMKENQQRQVKHCRIRKRDGVADLTAHLPEGAGGAGANTACRELLRKAMPRHSVEEQRQFQITSGRKSGIVAHSLFSPTLQLPVGTSHWLKPIKSQKEGEPINAIHNDQTRRHKADVKMGR